MQGGTSFSTFSVFILSDKKVNQSEGYGNFQDNEHQLQENSSISLIAVTIIGFYEIFIKLTVSSNNLKS